MDCQDLVELVTDFLGGKLSEDVERRFVDHLAECPHCEAYLAQFRVTIDALGELPPETISDEARGDLLSAFRGWRRG